jgi:hypothetical protein
MPTRELDPFSTVIDVAHVLLKEPVKAWSKM